MFPASTDNCLACAMSLQWRTNVARYSSRRICSGRPHLLWIKWRILISVTENVIWFKNICRISLLSEINNLSTSSLPKGEIASWSWVMSSCANFLLLLMLSFLSVAIWKWTASTFFASHDFQLPCKSASHLLKFLSLAQPDYFPSLSWFIINMSVAVCNFILQEPPEQF